MNRFALPGLAIALLLGCGGSDNGGAGGNSSSDSTGNGHPSSSTGGGGHAGMSSSGNGGAGGQGNSTTTAAGGASTTGSSGGTAGGSAGSTGGSGAGGGTANAHWVLGYYVGYSIDDYPIAQIDWSGITHIAFSPLVLKGDLSLDLSFSDSHGTGVADAMAVSQAAHAHGVKALLMLGGEGAGGNIATAANAGHRAAFVTALLGALDQLGYDGIDLDWEDSVNLDDLVALAQALRAARPTILLTYPGGAINGNFQTVDPHMVTLAASLDQFNVQTYYPSTAVAGQGWDSWFSSPVSGVSGSTPIAIDDTLQRYAAAGVPKAKLGLGIAFYAICYTGGISGPRQPMTSGQQIVGGDNNYPLSAFFAATGTFASSTNAEQKVDAVAQVPFLSLANAVNDSHCGASTKYITYDDETSIEAKGTFAKSNGYGGVIVWTLEEGWLPQGATGGRAQNALMQALKHGFIDP